MLKSLLIILSLLPYSQYWEDSETVRAMRRHVEAVTAPEYEGRAPGSAGEEAAASYVADCLSDRGLELLSGRTGDLFGVDRENGDTVISRNVIAYLPGYDATLKNHYVVVGAHLDNLGANTLTVDGNIVRQIYPGANANASGLAVLLELAGQASRNSILFKRSVLFVAFGASVDSFAGAWHFLHHTFGKDAGRIDAMVNLDILGCDREGLMAFTAGNEDLNHIISGPASSHQPVKVSLVPTEPYPSDHQVFYNGNIPSVLFTSGRYPEHNTFRDTPDILDFDFMERTAEYLYNFLLSLANSPEGVPSFYNEVPEEGPGDGDAVAWADCDVPPAFLGNINPAFFLEKWVYQYLKYPEACIRDGVQGRVMVEFTIGKDGTVSDVKVNRGVDAELDEAAVKVVSASPKWRPARKGGKKVACRMTIPVEFRLKKRK